MISRRLTMLLAFAAVALAAGTAGAALGGAFGTPKAPKCKANACASFDKDGGFIGAHPGVVSVSNGSDGHYCVELDPKIDAFYAYPQLTVDYSGSPGIVNVAQKLGLCGTNGVSVINVVNDSGTPLEK